MVLIGVTDAWRGKLKLMMRKVAKYLNMNNTEKKTAFWMVIGFIAICWVASMIGSMANHPGHANCGSGNYSADQCE